DKIALMDKPVAKPSVDALTCAPPSHSFHISCYLKVLKKTGCHAVSDAAVATANCDLIVSRVAWRSSNDFLRAGARLRVDGLPRLVQFEAERSRMTSSRQVDDTRFYRGRAGHSVTNPSEVMRRGGTSKVIDETKLGVPMLKQKCLLVSPHGLLQRQ